MNFKFFSDKDMGLMELNEPGLLQSIRAVLPPPFSQPLIWLRERIKRIRNKKTLFDVSQLIETCKQNYGDLTFLEAYDRTGRIVNISVSSTSSGAADKPWYVDCFAYEYI